MDESGHGGSGNPGVGPSAQPPAVSEAVLVFRRLAGDDEGRRVAEIFAAAMEAAHGVSPGAWAMTCAAAEARVCLEVGRVPALSLCRDGLALLVARGTEPGARWEKPHGDVLFRSLPGASVVKTSLDVAFEGDQALREAHLEGVREAAGSCAMSPWRRAHVSTLVNEIGRLVGRALPKPEYPAPEGDLPGRLLGLLNEMFPEWQGVDDPRFQKEEIEYKRATVTKAQSLLSRPALQQLMDGARYEEIVDRLDQVGKDNNLLFRGVPMQGDMGILYQETLDKGAFSRAVFELLHGDSDAADRLAEYVRFVEDAGLPNKWTFPTYFLFAVHPESEIFIKPEATSAFLGLAGAPTKLGAQPSAAVYREVRELAQSVRSALADYGVHDMVEAQSVMWVCASVEKELAGRLVPQEKRDRLAGLFDRFVRTYLGKPVGTEHAQAYATAREAFGKSFAEIVRRREAGEDVTESVLLKLLPHADTANNRERGAWVHVAPVVTKDVQQWFEGAGWTRPEDWPTVASAIVDLLVTCNDDPGKLREACLLFSNKVPSKGFQAGILSPGLNALRPDEFVIVNRKPKVVAGHFSGSTLTTALADYPDTNTMVLQLVRELAPILGETPGPASLPLTDCFDMFCHWLVAVDDYAFRDVKYWKIAPGEQGRMWDECREGSYISLGWSEMGDLTGVRRKEFDARAVEALERHEDWTRQGLEQLWKFVRQVKEGDRIVANRGTSQVLGVGTVAGPYYFVEGEEYGHRIPVEWEDIAHRKVDKPGWKRTLIALTRPDFEGIVEATSMADESAELRSGVAEAPAAAFGSEGGGRSLFTSRTFELLGMLHENPRVEVYTDHRDDFREYLEEPFRQLFARLARRLPQPMLEALETEKRITSRIRKNDWGRGGAWDHYWGAFYPKGGKRVSDAQLFVWMDHTDFGYGFYMGEYASEQRRRFLRNCSENSSELAGILAPQLEDLDVSYGRSSSGSLELGDNPPADVQQWLQDPEGYGLHVGVKLTKEKVTALSVEELVESVATAFERLFPLILTATEDDPILAIREYLEPGDDEEVDTQEEYTLADCASDLNTGEETVSRWVRAVNRKGQIVLYGPPGTGKTYVAEHLAKHLVSGQDGFLELVQFHPSYAYEDFIQGLRPEVREDGNLSYRLVPGRFLDFCKRASRRRGPCVLIVDEINRANLSRVFGELMYLLEYRKEEVPLAGGRTLRIPANVRLIGTMNTADRSIALVDHALRRRFAFVPLRPDMDILRRYHGQETGFDVEGLVRVLGEVNGAIADPNYEVGISFFLREDLEAEIADIWRMEIEPYLEEYFFDRPANVDRFRWDQVTERIHGNE